MPPEELRDELRPTGCGWLVSRCQPVIQSAVVTILMPASRTLHVEILVGEDAVEGQHVGFGGDDLLDGAGGLDAVRRQAGELTRVTTDLFRRVAVQTDQLKIGLLRRCA